MPLTLKAGPGSSQRGPARLPMAEGLAPPLQICGQRPFISLLLEMSATKPQNNTLPSSLPAPRSPFTRVVKSAQSSKHRL